MWTNRRVFMFGFVCFLAGSLCGQLSGMSNTMTISQVTEESQPAATEAATEAATKEPSASQAKLPSFTDVLIESKSDKYDNHHYEHYYTDWFEPYRMKTDMRMVEIGVDAGKSMKLWKDYFIHAERLVGLVYHNHPKIEFINQKTKKTVVLHHSRIHRVPPSEIKREHEAADSRVKIIEGDQSRMETMEALCQEGPYDIILDDGSHLPSHVMYSLYSLWNCVKEGGMYIIEDIETSYWDEGNQIYGYPLNETGFDGSPFGSVAAKLKQLIDVLIKEKTDLPKGFLSIMPGDESLCKIEFGRNVFALHKCSAQQKATPPKWNYAGQTFNLTRTTKWLEEAKASNPKEYYMPPNTDN